jgi:hypothetical protein
MNPKYSNSIAFMDFLFNLLLVFVALFLVALLLINPPEESADIDKSISYIVTIRWDSETTHDIDLWITDGKETVGFLNRQSRNMTLDRDDLGNDLVSVAMGIRVNEESVSILSPEPGTYTVNIHAYTLRNNEIVPVKVYWLLRQVRPRVRNIDKGEVYLSTRGEEKTLVRFTLNDEGNVESRDHNNYPFVVNRRTRDLVP